MSFYPFTAVYHRFSESQWITRTRNFHIKGWCRTKRKQRLSPPMSLQWKVLIGRLISSSGSTRSVLCSLLAKEVTDVVFLSLTPVVRRTFGLSVRRISPNLLRRVWKTSTWSRLRRRTRTQRPDRRNDLPRNGVNRTVLDRSVGLCPGRWVLYVQTFESQVSTLHLWGSKKVIFKICSIEPPSLRPEKGEACILT